MERSLLLVIIIMYTTSSSTATSKVFMHVTTVYLSTYKVECPIGTEPLCEYLALFDTIQFLAIKTGWWQRSGNVVIKYPGPKDMHGAKGCIVCRTK